jgi:hypothetical protein
MGYALLGTAVAKLNSPVFIIGGSRTGSEMLKTMLSASPDLNFTNELYALCPWWLHRDLRVDLRDHVGDLRKPGALDAAIALIYSGKLFGWTWRHAETELDRAMLRDELAKEPLSVESIVTGALRVNARLRNKPRQGAKFPVHYAYAPLLFEWYPTCRLIHTTRDPRAVYASQANKYLALADGTVKRAAIRAVQFAHVNIQVAWTARLHTRLCARENYRLIRYEDLLRDPEGELRKLCRFIDVEFGAAMLEPRKYGSTFESNKGQRGIDRDSMDAWRRHVSPATLAALRVLQGRAAKTLGYSLDHRAD